MYQYLKTTIIIFLLLLFAMTAGLAQSVTMNPPNPVFRISTPTAYGNSKTGNINIRFSLMNYSISTAQFQLFPYQIKAMDETNTQHLPVSILLGRKTYRKQEMISVDLMPGDSISCQLQFSTFKKTFLYIPEMTAKNRVIMSPLFNQESVLNIRNLPIYWQ